MITPSELAAAFARNVSIARAQTEGLTHEQSLLQLPFRGNCLNWVLGHMAASRDEILEALGQPLVMGDQADRYRRESEPLTRDSSDALPLADLMDLLSAGQERIGAALQAMSEEEMAREIVVFGRPTTIARRTFFLYFHECYHVGQTEIFRQLAGTDDKII